MSLKTKEFYAEEMLCASEYLDVPVHVINIAKKILGKEEVFPPKEKALQPPTLTPPPLPPPTPPPPIPAPPIPKLLVGKVTSLHGDIVELDIGAVQGAKVGDPGRILYKVTIDGKEKPVYLARFRITHISERSCIARIEESTDEVRVGQTVEVKLGTD